jgi:hypothetical protein
VWARTLKNGAKMPLNADPDPNYGNVVLFDNGDTAIAITMSGLTTEARNRAHAADIDLYVAHHATCPFAKEYRTKRAG